MTKSQKRELTMIIIGAVLLAAAVAVTHIFSEIPRWSKLLIFAVPYIVLGLNVILDAVHGLAGKQFLDEKFLMSVASVGALAVGEYAEAVLVMLLYRLGELLQSIAVGKSRRSIADLMDICPESAELETVDGIKQVSPDEVHVGDIFVVRAGERVPLDGIVVEGSSSLNTAALTGESAPRDVAAGGGKKNPPPPPLLRLNLLSFDTTSLQAGNEIFLAADEDDEHGEQACHRHGKDVAPLGELMLAEKA